MPKFKFGPFWSKFRAFLLVWVFSILLFRRITFQVRHAPYFISCNLLILVRILKIFQFFHFYVRQQYRQSNNGSNGSSIVSLSHHQQQQLPLTRLVRHDDSIRRDHHMAADATLPGLNDMVQSPNLEAKENTVQVGQGTFCCDILLIHEPKFKSNP